MAAHEPAPAQLAAASPNARPLSPTIVCGVAVVVAVTWLGAALANLAPLDALPVWLRGIARTPVVLAVPALAIPALLVLVAWPRRARPARHARSL